ncbi:alpha-amylase family glycosyl hydrolase [Sphingomonas sp. BT-65]|uniref:alpha-amylase family glycosyl hydrolase n=1 Tax=Sphingomonas sp. BT-65 TaxID=2989821 RepID=UPI00223668C8|nr:alpha-amylase family glycosyl hydrolase [Sphingomonas sp. BT-65]MCW4463365.1 alpha-amylase family glycosyl hydrolase [Sphingomonas sp. BT-65]
MRTLALAFALLAGTSATAQTAAPADLRARAPEMEVLYFLLPDRFENGDPANDQGGLKGDRLATGYDPASKGFFHGGDLKGLVQRLDYIQSLGATAIWLGPIYKNKPVQGPKGEESAGYHGYWITDFTRVDPHFGTNAEMKAFVEAAHARGIKVYLDIITNHTADVIRYRECGACDYRSRADYPYQRKGGVKGAAINPGFAGDGVQTPENFARLTDPNYAYTPFVPVAEKGVKVPAWLNDPIHYHNRGNTTFRNESSTMGDFVGLDDLMTESPRVLQGFIDIYGAWIDQFGIDGFRIDTARHVNPEFWQGFSKAMIDRAKAKGIPNFHIFGEVANDGDVGDLALHTRVHQLPSVLDFGFRAAVQHTVAGEKGPDVLAAMFDRDALYEGGAEAALRLPTFISNHDHGRFSTDVRKAFPKASDDEVLARVKLGHAMLLLLRGVPTIYAGDEQGFVGDGNDQDAREDMFPSKVAIYNDNKLLGTSKTTAESNFDTGHPLYAEIARLAALRKTTPALSRGRQVTRAYDEKPGLFAVSRFDPVTGAEVLVAFNTSGRAITRQVEVGVGATTFTALVGQCAPAATAPGSVTVTLPPFGYVACAAGGAK